MTDPEQPQIPMQDLSHLSNVNLNNNYYNASGECPAPVAVDTAFGTVYIEYTPACNLMERLAPLIVAISYILGAYIIVRGR